jgi:hypothetical protein
MEKGSMSIFLNINAIVINELTKILLKFLFSVSSFAL